MTDTIQAYTIEDNVPLAPKVVGGRKGVSKYPFGDLEISQSFAVPYEKRTAVRSALAAFRKSNKDIKFNTRILNEDGQMKLRVWRVE